MEGAVRVANKKVNKLLETKAKLWLFTLFKMIQFDKYELSHLIIDYQIDFII